MIIISENGADYETLQMTRLMRVTATIDSVVWYQVCISFGLMFDGTTTVEDAYVLYQSQTEANRDQIHDWIRNAIRGHDAFFDVNAAVLEL